MNINLILLYDMDKMGKLKSEIVSSETVLNENSEKITNVKIMLKSEE